MLLEWILSSVALAAADSSQFPAWNLAPRPAVRSRGADPLSPLQEEGWERAPLWDASRAQHYVEIALGTDAFWVSYRNLFQSGRGHFSLGLLGNDDEGGFLNARLMRYGEPRQETPLGLGVGVGAYAVELDEPDATILSLALTGAVDYRIESQYPVVLGADVSFAPDVSTFSDGDGLFDLWLRAELELSDLAVAFLGFRFVEVGLEDDQPVTSADVTEGLAVGVRLGF